MDSLFFMKNSHKINLKWINYDEKKRMNANIFPKDLAYRFSTLLVAAGCYLIRDSW
jgi:hypothetical protein